MTYSTFMMASLPSFVIIRAIPVLGISFLFSLIAYKNPDDLAIIFYAVAFFSVIAATISMLLATVSNRVANIAKHPEKMDAFFSGGFTLSLLLGLAACVLCGVTLAVVLGLPSANALGSEALLGLSIIYIPAATLLPINVFLQSFSEASGKARQSAKLKLLITTISTVYLIICFYCCPADRYKYYAMSYFLLTELLTLIALLNLNKHLKYFSINEAKSMSRPLLNQGAPVAAGTAGQKICFFLIIERLATANVTLNKELSITMSIITLMTLPSLALSQLHSIRVSSTFHKGRQNYNTGLAWAAALSLATALSILWGGDMIFALYSNHAVSHDSALAWSMATLMGSSTFLALATGHLRALNQTLAPQLINTLMLGGLIPIVYAVSWQDEKVTLLLHLQALALALAFFILHRRIMLSQKIRPVHSTAEQQPTHPAH